MKQSIAKGYIKKVKSISDERSITNKFAAYKGNLTIDKNDIIVEIYTTNENFQDKEVFVKLSTDKPIITDRIL